MAHSDNRLKLSKGLISGLEVPDKRKRFYDTQQAGLSLIVTPNGGKVFYFQRQIKGRGTLERKNGSFGVLTVEQARSKAAKYQLAFNTRIDPDSTDHATTTMSAIYQEYLDDFKSKLATGERREVSYRNVDSIWRNHLEKPFGKRVAASITPEEVKTFFRTCGKKAVLTTTMP